MTYNENFALSGILGVKNFALSDKIANFAMRTN